MKVAAPKGYHWMKQPNGSYKLMKHSGKFVKHKGASLKADFKYKKDILKNNGNNIFRIS